MERKSYNQMTRFLPDICQLRSRFLPTFVHVRKKNSKSLKLLSRQVEYSFDNLAEILLPKRYKNFLLKVRK